MIQFNYVAVLALIAVTMCWSLAGVLYRVGTPAVLLDTLRDTLGILPADAAMLESELFEDYIR